MATCFRTHKWLFGIGIKFKEKKIFNGEAYNFGPSSVDNYDVEYIIKKCSKLWEKKKWKISNKKIVDESGLLKLNSDKAFNHLNWKSKLNLNQTLNLTIDWYKHYYNNPKNILDFSNQQIEYYEKIKSNN